MIELEEFAAALFDPLYTEPVQAVVVTVSILVAALGLAYVTVFKKEMDGLRKNCVDPEKYETLHQNWSRDGLMAVLATSFATLELLSLGVPAEISAFTITGLILVPFAAATVILYFRGRRAFVPVQ